MPALTAANLLAWSIQVAVLVVAGGMAIRTAHVHSPRLRLLSFRALLVGCLLLPFIQPLKIVPAGPELKVGADDRQAYSSAGTGPRFAGPETQSGATASGLGPGATTATVTPATASPTSSPAASRGFTLPSWAATVVAAVLVAGIAARLSWLLVGVFALGRLRRRSTPLAGISPVAELGMALAGAAADVRLSPAVRRPVTFGLFRPVVLLPAPYLSLGEKEQATVLCHELLHVRRGDWLQTVAEELVRAVVWFNPAIWWLVGQIDLSREQLVDQEVVALTEHRQPYLNALVTLALTPAGPILRPASLFLGRAHLLQRVALLSREVRMSRARLITSLVLVTFALVFGGCLAVQAFPLTSAPRLDVGAAPAPPTSPALAIASTKVPAPPLRDTVVGPGPSEVPAAPAQAVGQQVYAKVVNRVEPGVVQQTGQPGEDRIVIVPVTIGTGGDVTNIRQIIGLGPAGFQLGSSTTEGFERMLAEAGRATARAVPGGWSEDVGERARAAYDAVRAWRFEPLPAPLDTVVGFNFARTEQSGIETVPIPIGGNMRAPARLKHVAPEYPADAQGKGIQGVVILEMTVDGAGIPVTAYAIRPIESLTLPAVRAALQWRYTPDANYTRRLMTVTVSFTLTSNNVAGVTSGVTGGVSGGVAGGVTGGVVGGIQGVPPPPPPSGYTSSFGPPRAEWPAQFVRVGGNIAQPTKIVDVKPVYPEIAAKARVQGVTILEVLIGTDGRVQAGQILRSIPLLDQAAIDAVKQWEYTPTLLNGAPVPVVMTVTVNFTLASNSAGSVASGGGGGGRGGVMGGVSGGVAGGVTGGIVSGLQGVPPPPPPPTGYSSSFGLPRDQWPQYVRVGGEIKQPTRIVDVKAVYPQLAIDARVQGVVICEVLIGTDGKVQAANILRSIPLLDQAALDAVKQWEYTPTLLNGNPVAVVMTVTVNFTLQ